MMTAIENTPKELFKTKEQYLLFINTWKQNYKENKDKITSTHFLIYSIFRNKDWRKCFTPCTNKNKINGGHKPYYSAFNSFFHLKYSDLSVFNGMITKEMISVVMNYLPNSTEFDSGNMIPSSPYKNITSLKEVA
jgi:hypothetical protein